MSKNTLKKTGVACALILLSINTALAALSWSFKQDMRQGLPSHQKGTWAFMQNVPGNNNPALYTLLPTYQKGCDLTRWRMPIDPNFSCWQDIKSEAVIGTPTKGVFYLYMLPGKDNQMILRWKSPITGSISMTGRVTDTDNGIINCNAGGHDGIKWFLRTDTTVLKQGVIANGKGAHFVLPLLSVKKASPVYLVIDKAKNNWCDSTDVDWVIKQQTSTSTGAVSPARPDLSVSITQPAATKTAPTLTATALSEIPVTVRNNGTIPAKAPITLTMPIPANIEMPAKFARNADAWVCLNKAKKNLTCTYGKSIAGNDSTLLRLPVTPTIASLGKKITPFAVTVSAVVGEKKTTNNHAQMTAPSPVKKLNLKGINLYLPDKKTSMYNNPLPIISAASLPKYALPLPNVFNKNFRFKADTSSNPGTDLYKLQIKQISTHILPPGYPATRVFAYGDRNDPSTFSYPAHTIVAYSTAKHVNKQGQGRETLIQFQDTRNSALPHLLPVDHTIHGAMAGEPDIRSIVHLHGFKEVPEESDGYPESWGSPSGKIGDQFVPKGVTTVPHDGDPVRQLNNQEASLLWFHDHTLGITRLNVYSGLAGLYLLRDSNEQNLINTHQLPSEPYEIPIVLQDRMFHIDGSLAYPDRNEHTPNMTKQHKPSIRPEFFGDVMVVNGTAWPYLEVEPRRYRFRMLNGSNARFYTLSLSNNAYFYVLGTEGGFLNAPLSVKELTIAPGERFDVIIDFSTARHNEKIQLINSAKAPFGNTGPEAVAPPKAGGMNQVMQFQVTLALSKTPNTALKSTLRPSTLPALHPKALVRKVLLAETTDNNGRVLPMLGTVENGVLGWMDTGTERPLHNSTETWEIYNTTGDAHPIHLHGGHFQLLNRQVFVADANTNMALTNIKTLGNPESPKPYERTWKDTVISRPNEVTRINVKFENPGLFVWHCHILEHEDHDMMRPLLVQ